MGKTVWRGHSCPRKASRGNSLLPNLFHNSDLQFLAIRSFQERLVLFAEPKLYWIVYNPLRLVAKFACFVLREINKVVEQDLEHVKLARNRRSHSADHTNTPRDILD